LLTKGDVAGSLGVVNAASHQLISGVDDKVGRVGLLEVKLEEIDLGANKSDVVAARPLELNPDLASRHVLKRARERKKKKKRSAFGIFEIFAMSEKSTRDIPHAGNFQKH
jgi:hypothetical protein